jgi:uncharacterized protein (TIGR03437 family)
VNAASFAPDAVVAGSLATIKGSNLSGSNLAVTFDGIAARITYRSSEQLNVQVPPELGQRANAQLLVAVNTDSSLPYNVALAPSGPGIFVPGILNEDSTVNGPENPATAGSYVQIFTTGMLTAQGGGVVDLKIHDEVYTTLPYAGPAPSSPGVQQINARLPERFPTMTTEALVCSTAGGRRACSPPVKISIRQR